MCYSLNKSQSVFWIGIFGAVLLFVFGCLGDISDHKILGIIFGFVAFMQLFDSIFWLTDRSVKSENRNAQMINKLFTYIAIIFNHLQPIVAGMAILYYKGKLSKSSIVSLGIYFVISSIYTVNCFFKVSYTIEQPPASPGLFWGWNSQRGWQIMYSVFCITIAILLFENLGRFASSTMIAFIFGTLYYSLERYGGKSDGGRWWCNYASYIPLTYLMLFSLSDS